MILAGAACVCLLLILVTPEAAFAWGPVTHVAVGGQAIATVISTTSPLQVALLKLPEVFLYGSLAPDIVQGRRLQSRLRRHSHNWATGMGLLRAASGKEEQTFALGYLAHLAADVVAHNFFLPARYIGRFDSAVASHIYAEARFDSFHDLSYRELLAELMAIDFGHLNATLKQAVDSPFMSFAAHHRIFERGLRGIRHFDRAIRALGGPSEADRLDFELFSASSLNAVTSVIEGAEHAPVCRFDPMGEQAVRSALASRRSLRRLTRMSPAARHTANRLAGTMLADLRNHLRQIPFGPPEA